MISINRKSVHLGMFATAEEAALAYNAKSLELYGHDGKLNEMNPASSSANGGRPRPGDARSSESPARVQVRRGQ